VNESDFAGSDQLCESLPATQEELWKFLHQPISREAVPPSIPYRETIRVSSIFLISRSSCAFINIETQEELILAIAYFSHRALRSSDPLCPKLVCRVRKMDDELNAGVGGQRGTGLHAKYVQGRLAKDKAQPTDSPVDTGQTNPQDVETVPVSLAAFEYPPIRSARRRSSATAAMIAIADSSACYPARSHSDTHSIASTTSSFLGRHFPNRYFILKSFTEASRT
jgi:hypothetical protein